MTTQEFTNLSDMTPNELTRYTQLLQWLNIVITEQDFRVESLPNDASFRCYHRIYLGESEPVQPADNGGENSQKPVYIVMDAPPEKESIIEFVQVAELMANTVNVPDIIARDMENGFLMLQDFGSVEFAHLLVDADKNHVDGYYQQAMQALAKLQTIDITHARQQSIPDYNDGLLKTEMTLFSEWFLPYIGIEMNAESDSLWDELQTELLTQIQAQPKVLVHRDYHSRNLMQDCNSDKLGIIDFQDAVVGAYSYDLVSLLRDAYVCWDEEQIGQWKRDFWELLDSELKVGRSFEQFYQDVMVMGVQRHLKVLGIFVRLSERDGKARYLKDIPKVMDDLVCELNWLTEKGEGNIQSVCKSILPWFNNQVLPAYKVTFS